MERRTEVSDHFMHAGSSTGTALVYLGLIPGVIPFVALTVVVGVVLVLPVVVLGLAVGLIVAPPYAAWRLVTRRRPRGSQREPASGTTMPAPFSGMC